MVKISKHIGSKILFVIGIFILFHAIIPHHHHFGFEKHHESCTQNELNLNHVDLVNIENHETGNHHDYAICHFKIDITNNIKYTIDNFFVYPENEFNINSSSKVYKINNQHISLYSYKYLNLFSCRGPPSLA